MRPSVLSYCLYTADAMFGERAFQSWLHILIGALAFALLFALAMLMAERVVEGTFAPTPRVWLFGAAAFAGYLAVARCPWRRTVPPGDM